MPSRAHAPLRDGHIEVVMSGGRGAATMNAALRGGGDANAPSAKISLRLKSRAARYFLSLYASKESGSEAKVK
jgi:hypothetical protein